MRKTFINTLIDLARKDPDIVLITPDMGFSILEPFFQEFPERSFNVGIAEQNAVSMASGLALMGKKPYVYTIIPFLVGRAYEQIRLDVAYMNANVKLIGIGAGFTYGTCGATHHALEDIALMRNLANMTVCAPGDNYEAEQLIRQTYQIPNPTYIRIGRHNRGIFNHTTIQLGKGSVLKEGEDIAIIATSNMLPGAHDYWKYLTNQGRKPWLISMHTLSPLDTELLQTLIANRVEIHTLEEHWKNGGLGTAVAEVIAESGIGIKFKRLAIPQQFIHYIGNQQALKKHVGLDWSESL